LTLVPTARSCWLLTVGGVRGAVTLAGVMSVPLLLVPGQDFPERDLLIFIAAGVILLSLIAACIALPLLLRGVEKSPDEKRHNEVREAWKKTAVAAIHALEAEEPLDSETSDAAQAALATELKARLDGRNTAISWKCSTTRPKPRRLRCRWTCSSENCGSRPCVRNAWSCTA